MKTKDNVLSTAKVRLVLPEETAEPFHLMFGKTITWTENIGLWLTPDKTYTDTGIAQLFVPWRFIVTIAVVLDGQRSKVGFRPTT